MLEHCDQHGGNAKHGVAAIGVEHLEYQRWVERLDQDLCRRLRDSAHHAADAAAGVKQRHGGDEHVAGVDAHPVGGVGAVIEKSAMTEQGALWKARGARSVLDHHGIVGGDGGKSDARIIARGDESVPIVEADDLPQLRAVRLYRLHRLQHRVSAKTVDDEDAGRTRLLQHILQLVGAEGRVHGDQHDARHAGAELEHDPFRDVLRPYRDTLALLEPGEQRPRGALCLAVQLGVGPFAPQRRIRHARDQGEAIRRGFRRVAQKVAERHLPHRRRAWSRDMRHRQSHVVLPGRSYGQAAVVWEEKCLRSETNAS